MDNYDGSKNDEALHLHLDLVDEVRATAEQRLAVGTIPKPYGKELQLLSQAQKLPGRRPGLEEGNGRSQGSCPRKARPQLGGTLQSHIMAEEWSLPSGVIKRVTASTSMER